MGFNIDENISLKKKEATSIVRLKKSNKKTSLKALSNKEIEKERIKAYNYAF